MMLTTQAFGTTVSAIDDATDQLIFQTEGLDLPTFLRYPLMVFLCFLFLIGTTGNILTLLALPYVRSKYQKQFSVLQTSTAILLLHLSFCDLLYNCIGFTHFIHILYIGKLPSCYSSFLIKTFRSKSFFHTQWPNSWKALLCFSSFEKLGGRIWYHDNGLVRKRGWIFSF